MKQKKENKTKNIIKNKMTLLKLHYLLKQRPRELAMSPSTGAPRSPYRSCQEWLPACLRWYHPRPTLVITLDLTDSSESLRQLGLTTETDPHAHPNLRCDRDSPEGGMSVTTSLRSSVSQIRVPAIPTPATPPPFPARCPPGGGGVVLGGVLGGWEVL